MAENKSGGPKAMTKSEVYQQLATAMDVNRKQVAQFFEELAQLIKRDLGKKGPGVFTIPGLFKLKRIARPARKARKGIHPITKEETLFKAKPASTSVRARPLKGLKDMIK